MTLLAEELVVDTRALSNLLHAARLLFRVGISLAFPNKGIHLVWP
jgi:hypothetical protein